MSCDTMFEQKSHGTEPSARVHICTRNALAMRCHAPLQCAACKH